MEKTIRNKAYAIWCSLKLIQQHSPLLLPATVIQTLSKAFAPFIAIYMSARIIDELLGARSVSRLSFYVLLTVTLKLVVTVLEHSAQRLSDSRTQLLYAYFDHEMDQLILSTDYENVENPDFHLKKQKIDELANMSGNPFQQLVKSLADLLSASFTVGIAVILAWTAFFTPAKASLWINSPWIAAVMILLILITSGYSLIATAQLNHALLKDLDDVIVANRRFLFYSQFMHNHETGKDIRLYRQQPLLNDAFQTFSDAFVPVLLRLGRLQGRSGLTEALFSSLISGLVYLFVGLKALAGLISVGFVVQYVGAISQFTTSLSSWIGAGADLWMTGDALVLYIDFINTKSTKYEGTLPVEKRSDNDYCIEFRDVSFKYPGAATYALRHVSVKLSIGTHFAVVGRNGSGKTTFIKLLCRLYDPSEGDILLNGISIQKYDYQQYLTLFSVIFQDFQLFAFSAGQNVATNMTYNPADVNDCLDKAGVKERITRMPKGLDTPLYKIDADGEDISGGEAQKIAIARALYKHAPFIILDEPTAALDPIAEYDIYSRFQALTVGQTAIYISHRLASCRFCDQILVFDSGQIIQHGTHDRLLEDKAGLYVALWDAQAQYYQRRKA
ncbi:MAG: ABC transporter ATP-binding protein [Sporolactobacillus sp.]